MKDTLESIKEQLINAADNRSMQAKQQTNFLEVKGK